MVNHKRKQDNDSAKVKSKKNEGLKKKSTESNKSSSLIVQGITGRVLLSNRDKAPEIGLSPDQLTCYGDGGYRMVRATHGVHLGLYFWEAEILNHPGFGKIFEKINILFYQTELIDQD